MPGRRVITVGAAALLIGAACGLLLSRPERGGEAGTVRIVAAPAATPSPAAAPLPAASPTPPPVRAASPPDSGVDPPARREAGSPNYADLGVLPAI